jgi:hypothetical protein
MTYLLYFFKFSRFLNSRLGILLQFFHVNGREVKRVHILLQLLVILEMLSVQVKLKFQSSFSDLKKHLRSG